MAQDRHQNATLLTPPPSPEDKYCSLASACVLPDCFRTIIDLAQEGIILLDGTARITFINKWLATMLGSKPEQLVGRPLSDFLEDTSSATLQTHLEPCRQGRTEVDELIFRWGDGTTRVGLVSLVPLVVNGASLGYLAAVTDISRLKELEWELRSARDFRDTVFNSITDNLIVIDPASCRVVMANDSFINRMGREPQEVLNQRCFEVMHNKEVPCLEEGYYCPVQETARLKRPV